MLTTRSLQWGQRILTVATDKFKKENIPNIQLNSGIFNILLKYIKVPHGVTRKGLHVCNSSYVGNVVQNIYYNPIQL